MVMMMTMKLMTVNDEDDDDGDDDDDATFAILCYSDRARLVAFTKIPGMRCTKSPPCDVPVKGVPHVQVSAARGLQDKIFELPPWMRV